MPIKNLMTDTINILTKDGSKFENIKAVVSGERITHDLGNILIETGDIIERVMSNGGKDTFEVIDPGFCEPFGPFPAHYQMKVKKLGAEHAKKSTIQSITYNINGNNSRINQNSTDNSTNIINIDTQVIEYINQLRSEIKKLNLSESETLSSIEIIDSVEAEITSGKPKKTVVSALLKALPHIASISTIAEAIITTLNP